MILSSSAFSFANGTKPEVNFFHMFFWYEVAKNRLPQLRQFSKGTKGYVIFTSTGYTMYVIFTTPVHTMSFTTAVHIIYVL